PFLPLLALRPLRIGQPVRPVRSVRPARDDAEIHLRGRPPAGRDRLDLVARHAIAGWQRARVNAERVASRTQVGERELAGGIGGRHLAILGPDVDTGQAGVTLALDPVAVPVDPHLPDRGPRL